MPETEKKEGTEERLIGAAIRLFSASWYGTVSVAAICREAGLSNGVYYRYFDSKEALFRRIIERVLAMIRDVVARPAGDTPRERFDSLISAVVDFSRDHPELIAIFREGQYRLIEYERSLVAIYMQALETAVGRQVGLPEYLFCFGGARFCAIRAALHGVDIDASSLQDILRAGLFRGQGWNPTLVFGGTATPLPLSLEAGARERLLRSGKRLIAEKGFYETNIHEVTDRAGLSVGSFYSYFDSKESYLAELIGLIGHDVRRFIARNMAAADGTPLNRLERELRGLWLWLVYLSIDKDCYPVVREGEFVVRAAVLDYYGHFAAGYRKNPDGNGNAHEQTAIEFCLGVAHYLGIEIAFDHSPSNARTVIEALAAYFSRGFSDLIG
jgi:AcrR family transcriptional regulator